MCDVASGYINFPYKVAEIVLLVWGRGLIIMGFIVYTFRLVLWNNGCVMHLNMV